jgi:iron complex outermembrane recepter protein
MAYYRHILGPCLLFAGGLSLGASVAAFAQIAAADPSVDSSQQSNGNTLAEVVVTATKRSENTLDVPISITAQSAASLAAAQITNVTDLTAVVPGLNYTPQASARPVLRGVTSLSSAAGAENNVAIYVDGIYQPDLYGNTFDMPDLNNVQVLKGPQGTLFGRNAEGGAILISSRDPSFVPTGDIKLSDGVYDGGDKGGYDVDAQEFLSAPVSNAVALSIASQYDSSDGYAHDVLRGGRTGKINSDFFRAKALIKPSDNARILVTAYYGERTDDSVYNLQNLNPLKLVPAIAPTQPYYIANDAAGLFRVERYGASLKGTFDFSAGTLTSLSGVSVVKPTIVADADGSSAPLQTYLLGQPNRFVSQEFDFASRKFGRLDFVSGAYASSSVERFTPLQVASTVGGTIYFTDYAKSTDNSYALFTEANYHITDRLTLVAGMRYSYEDREYQGSMTDQSPLPTIGRAHFDAFTPRYSLQYQLAPQTNVYFTYSKGFKSGLFDTSSFSSNVIKPETLKSYEVGIKSNPLPSLQVTAAVYHYDLSNLQVQTNTANGLAQLTNAGTAEIDGGELDVKWRVVRQLTISGGISYIPTAQYTEYPNAPIVAPDLTNGGGFNTVINGTGLRLAQAPMIQANAELTYHDVFSFGSIDVNVTESENSGFAYELSGFIYQKSYSLTNASIGWSPIVNPDFKVTLWGTNLTNTTWIGNYLSNGTAFDAVYQRPRELGVSVGYSF